MDAWDYQTPCVDFYADDYIAYGGKRVWVIRIEHTGCPAEPYAVVTAHGGLKSTSLNQRERGRFRSLAEAERRRAQLASQYRERTRRRRGPPVLMTVFTSSPELFERTWADCRRRLPSVATIDFSRTVGWPGEGVPGPPTPPAATPPSLFHTRERPGRKLIL